MKAEKFIKNELLRKVEGFRVLANIFLEMEKEITEILLKHNKSKSIKKDGTMTEKLKSDLESVFDQKREKYGVSIYTHNYYKDVFVTLKTFITWRSYESEPHRSDDGAYYELDFYLFDVEPNNENKMIFDIEKFKRNAIEKANEYKRINPKKCKETYNKAIEKIEEAKELLKELPYFFNISLPYPYKIQEEDGE